MPYWTLLFLNQRQEVCSGSFFYWALIIEPNCLITSENHKKAEYRYTAPRH